jgi:hypothetical protein
MMPRLLSFAPPYKNANYQELNLIERLFLHLDIIRHYLGIVQIGLSQEVVAAGGFNDAIFLDTVEIFNVMAGTWRTAGID